MEQISVPSRCQAFLACIIQGLCLLVAGKTRQLYGVRDDRDQLRFLLYKQQAQLQDSLERVRFGSRASSTNGAFTCSIAATNCVCTSVDTPRSHDCGTLQVGGRGNESEGMAACDKGAFFHRGHPGWYIQVCKLIARRELGG